MFHGFKIEMKRTAFPTKITQKRYRARKNRVLVIAANGIVTRMEIGGTRLQITNANEPFGKPVNRAFYPATIQLAIIVKMNTLSASMYSRIGTTRTRNANGISQRNRKSFF